MFGLAFCKRRIDVDASVLVIASNFRPCPSELFRAGGSKVPMVRLEASP